MERENGAMGSRVVTTGSSASVTIIGWGIWLLLGGATFLAYPYPLLHLGGMPAEAAGLGRILGIVLVVLAIYYIAMGRLPEARPLWKLSVYLRIAALPVGALMSAVGLLPAVVVIFVGIDALGGVITARALARDAAAPSPRPID